MYYYNIIGVVYYYYSVKKKETFKTLKSYHHHYPHTFVLYSTSTRVSALLLIKIGEQKKKRRINHPQFCDEMIIDSLSFNTLYSIFYRIHRRQF